MTAQNKSSLIVVLRQLNHFYVNVGGRHRFNISNGEDVYLELEPAHVKRVYDPQVTAEHKTLADEPLIEQYRENVQIVFADGVEYSGVNLGKHIFRDEACQKEFEIPYSIVELIAESESDNRYRELASFGKRQPEPQVELSY